MLLDMDIGGNISLAGFTELKPGELVVVKKIIGNYAKHVTTTFGDFEHMDVHRKNVHNSSHEVKMRLQYGGKVYASEVTDNNLYVALDKATKKISEEMSKLKK
jgi:ribosome-associated translation inhibitor RaiA